MFDWKQTTKVIEKKKPIRIPYLIQQILDKDKIDMNEVDLILWLQKECNLEIEFTKLKKK